MGAARGRTRIARCGASPLPAKMSESQHTNSDSDADTPLAIRRKVEHENICVSVLILILSPDSSHACCKNRQLQTMDIMLVCGLCASEMMDCGIMLQLLTREFKDVGI